MKAGLYLQRPIQEMISLLHFLSIYTRTADKFCYDLNSNFLLGWIIGKREFYYIFIILLLLQRS